MAEGHVRRRLVAILAADVVGYSRLMGRDEAKTLAALKSLRTELIDPKLASTTGESSRQLAMGCSLNFRAWWTPWPAGWISSVA